MDDGDLILVQAAIFQAQPHLLGDGLAGKGPKVAEKFQYGQDQEEYGQVLQGLEEKKGQG